MAVMRSQTHYFFKKKSLAVTEEKKSLLAEALDRFPTHLYPDRRSGEIVQEVDINPHLSELWHKISKTEVQEQDC